MRSRTPKPLVVTPEVKAERASSADDIDRCIADEFEDAPAGDMRAKEIRPIVLAWFERQGLPPPDEGELWAKMKARFKHDPNNGRPRYLGLRIKRPASPKLRIVSGSEA